MLKVYIRISKYDKEVNLHHFSIIRQTLLFDKPDNVLY